MNYNETIADIIAEKRRDAQHIRNNLSTVPVRRLDQLAEIKSLADEADRLEAAHRRERSDAAKLREAVEFCVKCMCGFCLCGMDAEARGMTARCVHGCELLLKVKAALAAPPRNCDRPECATTKAAQEVWRKEDGGKTAYYEWLLAPHKEGGKSGNE